MKKKLLYLTNTQLTACLWQSDRFLESHYFANNETGWRSLSAYLLMNPSIPIYILTDLIEEDFQRDTVPHVLGHARKALIERRLSQLYHDTPLRCASHQGRQKTGRRDDIMLFSALTNMALIKPWINAIGTLPIAGIYSTALLSTVLFAKLCRSNESVLFITHQSAGLRQNFFQDGYLRFSRLVQLPSGQADDVVQAMQREITKTRLFLANSRQLQRGERLNIVGLCHPDILNKVQRLADDHGSSEELANVSASTYRCITEQEIRHLPGLKYLPAQHFSDALFLLLLAKKSPQPHYQLAVHRTNYLLCQSRLVLNVMSVASIAGCLLWSGANLMEALYANNQFAKIAQQIGQNQRYYQEVADSMPKTVVDPHDMKTVVEVHNLIEQHSSTPVTLFSMISQVLNQMPQIRLNELDWKTIEPNDTNNSAATEQTLSVQGGDPAEVVSAAIIGLPSKPVEVVVLKGEVVWFNKNYRAALDSIQQFSNTLTKDTRIKVSTTLLPLDIRPSVTLSGEAGNANKPETAPFELRIIREI